LLNPDENTIPYLRVFVLRVIIQKSKRSEVRTNISGTPLKKWLPALLLLLTLLASWALSPWWNPWQFSLSALGSSSNGIGGAVYNSGLVLTSWSMSRLEVKKFSNLVEWIALLTALVAAVNIDFGEFHFMVASILFILIYVYILLHADVLAYVGSVVSVALWASHWTLGVPPGIALPELSAVTLALFYLLSDAR